MPARATPPPRAFPTGLGITAGLPEHKIRRALFVRCNLNTRTGNHLVHRPARQCAIIREAWHIEQHMAFRHIGMPRCNQPLHHGDHFSNRLRRQRFNVRPGNPKRAHISTVNIRIAFRNYRNLDAFFGRLLDDFVFNVGNVARVNNIWIKMPKHTREYIKHNRRPRIPYMRMIVNRRPTDIHGHPVRIQRRKSVLRACQVIMQVKRALGAGSHVCLANSVFLGSGPHHPQPARAG